jgi:hypothetical protein
MRGARKGEANGLKKRHGLSLPIGITALARAAS